MVELLYSFLALSPTPLVIVPFRVRRGFDDSTGDAEPLFLFRTPETAVVDLAEAVFRPVRVLRGKERASDAITD